jgi:hypothetical protein
MLLLRVEIKLSLKPSEAFPDRRTIQVDSYEEALERQHSLQSASYISAANILFAFVAIEGFPHDGLD